MSNTFTDLLDEINAITTTATPRERIAQLEKVADALSSVSPVPYGNTTAAFAMPALGGDVVVKMDTQWLVLGMYVMINSASAAPMLGGVFEVKEITDTATVVMTLIEDPRNAAAGVSIATGAKVAPTGPALASSEFTVPTKDFWVSQSDGNDSFSGSLFRPVLTLAKAKALAVAAGGGNIIVMDGTFDEYEIAANNVHWNFRAGSQVNVTTAAKAIFDDGGLPMVFRVMGSGIFTCLSGEVFIGSDPATDIYFECLDLSSGSTDQTVKCIDGARIVGVARNILNTSTGYCFLVNGGSEVDTDLDINARYIAATGGHILGYAPSTTFDGRCAIRNALVECVAQDKYLVDWIDVLNTQNDLIFDNIELKLHSSTTHSIETPVTGPRHIQILGSMLSNKPLAGSDFVSWLGGAFVDSSAFSPGLGGTLGERRFSETVVRGSGMAGTNQMFSLGSVEKTTVSGASTNTLNVGLDGQAQWFDVQAGAGVYALNIDLDNTSAKENDVFYIRITKAASANPTITIRNDAAATLLGPINSDQAEEYWIQAIYRTATGWEIWGAARAPKVETGTFFLQPEDFRARVSNGAGVLAAIESSVNKVNRWHYPFDSAADEYVQRLHVMPDDWNPSVDLKLTVLWSHAAATTFDVIWLLSAVSFGNDEDPDVAFVEASVTDSGGTTDKSYQAPQATVAVQGSPAKRHAVVFQVGRDADDGSDTLDVDARFEGLLVEYTKVLK